MLFLTRHAQARVRAAALRCLIAFASVADGEFLSLLPETLPYVSERMEDDSREVEALCHALLRKLEDLSGESLQEYLLVSQHQVQVEHYSRGQDNAWTLRDYRALTDTIALTSLGCSLSLTEVYDKVDLSA